MPERNLNSSQIAAYIDFTMTEKGIISILPFKSRLPGRTGYLKGRIDEIQRKKKIPVVGARGSRRGVKESNGLFWWQTSAKNYLWICKHSSHLRTPITHTCVISTPKYN